MKEKILKITILMVLLVVMYTTIVSALSMSLLMETDKTTIPAGTEFSVNFKIANLDMGENGVASVTGTLEYDKTVFEEITEGSVETVNEWGLKYEKDNKLILFKNTFSKKDEEIFNVTFKTKKDVDNKDGVIKFKDISAGETDSSVDIEDVSITIHVGTPDENEENKTNTNNSAAKLTPSNKANNTAKNTNTNSNTNTKTSNNAVNNTNKNIANTTKERIPDAGVSNELILLLVGFIVIAIGVYVKIEVINKEMKK